MKMHLPMMGLLACLAFSPQPAVAAPDTGPPSVDNSYMNNSNCAVTGTTFDITQRVAAEVANNNIIINSYAFGQASGQETDVFRSDHTVGNGTYLLNRNNVNKLVDLEFDEVIVSSGRTVALEPERSCSCMINGDNSFNQVNVKVRTAAALHSHLMVWVMKRPGWMPTLLC